MISESETGLKELILATIAFKFGLFGTKLDLQWCSLTRISSCITIKQLVEHYPGLAQFI